jgi:NAD(P)-dependent dehydrogenase (short-subunit alcohol dehydrogenase family)
MMTDLRGRVVMVTGASGLIGSAVCAALASEGARVVAHCHERVPTAQTSGVTANGLTVRADLTDEVQVRAVFDEARSTWGPVECCVACAGTWPQNRTALVDMTVEEWHRQFTRNALMTFLTVREYLQDVRTRGDGSLVLLGASSGTYGHPGRAHFAASKSAMTYGLLQSLVDEMTALAPRGRVNVVAPGPVDPGEGWRTGDEDESARRAVSALPDVVNADDVAAAVVWLLSTSLSGAVTGHVVRVDGGLGGRPRMRSVGGCG